MKVEAKIDDTGAVKLVIKPITELDRMLFKHMRDKKQAVTWSVDSIVIEEAKMASGIEKSNVSALKGGGDD
jgi:hypothetical protein